MMHCCQMVMDFVKMLLVLIIREKKSYILGKVHQMAYMILKQQQKLLKFYWNITDTKKKKLSLHYNWSNSFLYVNDVKIYNFIFKNSEMTTFTSRLDNILKDFANIDRKNSGLNVYQFVIIVLILKIFWIFINIKY